MDDSIISRMIQIGTVTDVSGKKARVKFQNTDITSDWLPVLQRTGEIVEVKSNGSHSHTITCSGEGCSPQSNTTGAHVHQAAVTIWAPKVNDTVVVVFLPVFNSDGFIIGGV